MNDTQPPTPESAARTCSDESGYREQNDILTRTLRDARINATIDSNMVSALIFFAEAQRYVVDRSPKLSREQKRNALQALGHCRSHMEAAIEEASGEKVTPQ